MAVVNANVNIDESTMKKAIPLLNRYGIDLSEIVNLYLQKLVQGGCLPTINTEENYNEVTLAAIRETEEMSKHPELYKGYQSVEAMVEDINRIKVSQ